MTKNNAKKQSGFLHQRPRTELVAKLKSQVSNFRRSSSAFDDGAFEEAERLASCVYVLLHDGLNSRSKSLMGQLGLKSRLRFPDTSYLKLPPEPGVAVAGPPLLWLGARDGVYQYGAPLGGTDGKMKDRMPRIAFSKWWEADVYRNSRGNSLSRKNLVFFMRSQDGGAHIDDHIRDEGYYRFLTFGDHEARSPDGRLAALSGGAGYDVSKLHFLTMRQIAWEVETAMLEDPTTLSELSTA